MHPGTSLAQHIEYVNENGERIALLTVERQKLHDQIAEDHLRGHKPSGGKPRVVFLGGGSAAGKSTITDSDILKDWPDDAVVIDADAIKRLLPEFDKHKPPEDAAGFTHSESYMIAQRIIQMAMERNLDIIVDGTGVTDMESKIKTSKRAGYTVRGVYVTAPVSQALRRNNERFKKTGRKVPEGIVRTTHSKASSMAPILAPRFDSFELWDARDGQPPVQIAHADGTPVAVDDAALYAEFVAKGR